MKLNELKIICNALNSYRREVLRSELKFDNYEDVRDLYDKYEKKLNDKTKRWYLVIRWSWSWYSWQNNCYKWERWSWCKKIYRSQYKWYNKSYIQRFNDWTENVWRINFEYDKPEVNNNLWWYEWRLREQWLPV